MQRIFGGGLVVCGGACYNSDHDLRMVTGAGDAGATTEQHCRKVCIRSNLRA
ncbi:MAG: hypothetical protein JW936_09035 [Sedimentisphaerales bacterium]|nr:hypothetical protein [Sedimentisphaerales bacterium]